MNKKTNQNYNNKKTPEKSTGSDKQTNTNKQEMKQTNKQNFRFRNNRISVLVYILVLLLQHLVMVLVVKQKLCGSLTRWLGSRFLGFFLSFRGSCLVSSSLSEVWQFRFVCCSQVLEISCVVHQLSCFGVGFSLCLITGSRFFASPPFSGARSVIHQPVPCCQHVMIVC
jgi:hypothetical protein